MPLLFSELDPESATDLVEVHDMMERKYGHRAVLHFCVAALVAALQTSGRERSTYYISDHTVEVSRDR